LAALGGVWRRIAELTAIDPRFQPYLDARDGIKSQLEDLAHFLRRYADGIEASPARLQQTEERLAMLERLKRKHGPTLADVIAKRDTLKKEKVDLERGDERLEELERDLRSAQTTFLSEAGKLAKERRRIAAEFGSAMEKTLSELAMDRSRFEVRFGEPLAEGAWTPDGIDVVEFYVSPNPGEELRPLARIVSGGELSRLMLAVKVLTFHARLAEPEGDRRRTKGSGAPGMIFDEIDAGIGGRVADVVGRKLRALGSAFQVLCITHLPQIAAYADTHFAIEKEVERGRTRTAVTRLTPSGRVDELSRMLGGEAITDAVRRSAREMLEERSGRARREAKGERAKGESPKAKRK
jgi:DNA repair protein RecN (Recombination protein N)